MPNLINLSENEVLRLRAELEKVLDKFNETSNIKMELQGAKYSVDVTFKLVGTKLDNLGNKVTKFSKNFGTYSYKHGLKESALNYEFRHEGKMYKVTGYNKSARKYPIEYTQDGEPYKCAPSFIAKVIHKSAPELLFT